MLAALLLVVAGSAVALAPAQQASAATIVTGYTYNKSGPAVAVHSQASVFSPVVANLRNGTKVTAVCSVVGQYMWGSRYWDRFTFKVGDVFRRGFAPKSQIVFLSGTVPPCSWSLY
jgi:hypothetical protein